PDRLPIDLSAGRSMSDINDHRGILLPVTLTSCSVAWNHLVQLPFPDVEAGTRPGNAELRGNYAMSDRSDENRVPPHDTVPPRETERVVDPYARDAATDPRLTAEE